jgi:tripartite-type tricarboxylate transporter receptor subunit TctC
MFKCEPAEEAMVFGRPALVAFFGFCVGFHACSGAAGAEVWPARPVRAIVPLTAGSATDVAARTVLNEISAQLGQPIIVENRPGAGNTIGMSAVARAEPDGYTLLINSSSHTVVPATFSQLPFDTLRDLVPVRPFGNVPIVVVISPAKGYKNLGDLVAAAKSKPGAISYATAGAGNFSHLATEAFRRVAGFDALHVPCRGAPEAIIEVLTGRVDFFFAPLPVALPLLKDGKLQALAVSGSQRAVALPNVPTTTEAGFPGSEYNFWVGMFVPNKTPSEIRERLYRETVKATDNPEVKAKLSDLGIDPMPISQEAFAGLVNREVVTNTEIAKAAGLKIN